MKKLIILFFAIAASINFALADDSGICGDNLQWSYNSTTHELTITGSGEMWDYSSSIPWYSYRSEITSVSLPNGLTSIGNYAFYNCSSLTNVTIPNSVTSIGEQAFAWCTRLTSITIPDGVTSIGYGPFSRCTGLTCVTWNAVNCSNFNYTNSPFYDLRSQITSFTIGNDVQSIPSHLCTGMNNLTNITIPNSVTSIGYAAFNGCTSLTSLTIGNGVTSIGEYAFGGCTGLTSVTWNAVNYPNFNYNNSPFYDLRSQITSFTIGNNVQSIPSFLCYGMSNLTSITIPNSVTSIGESAFRDCTGLTSVTIGNSVTSIGDNAFYQCTGLTSVTIPNSVTSIGDYAFYYCTGLTSVTIGNSVTSIGSYAFKDCTGLTSVTIGNSVTSIGNDAFSYCTGLTSMTIPNSVTSIGESAFNNVANIVYNGSATGSPWGAKSVNGYVDGYLVYNDASKTQLLACSSLAIGEIDIPNSVTSIGESAFSGCTSLTSVIIPNSVTSIGDNAFYWCTGLTSVTIPNSVTSIGESAFYWCTGLTSVTIGNSVTSIGGYAFSGCTGLTSVTIPNSVTSIGGWAFCGCSGLTSVTIPNSVTSIGEGAFRDCTGLTSVTIPNSVTSIGRWAFISCTGLTSLTIGNGVTSIGEYAFGGCTGLTSITIPESVMNIEDGAFNNVANIVYNGSATGSPWGARSVNGYVDGYLVYNDASKTQLLACFSAATGSITIPNSVTSIGDRAFYGCTGLTSITIPNSITSIGDNAFYGCSGLTSVNITDLDAWCRIDFNNNASNPLCYAHNLYLNGNLVTNLVIPETITQIRNYAFSGCTSLTNVIIPNSVTSIGDNAFYWCTGLTSVTIPNSVTSIGGWAFYNCTGLTSVTIGNGVTSIGKYAFDDTGLTSVTMLAETPPSLGDWAFPWLVVFYVPCGTKEQYQQAGYSNVKYAAYNLALISEHARFSYTPHNQCEEPITTITVTPDYGYEFVQWSDGNIDNPRSVTLTSDTTFTAICSPSKFELSIGINDETQGEVSGSGTYDYLTECTITATAYYGYHFTSWSDGNTQNPRVIQVTQDKTLTAYFTPNKYQISSNTITSQGSISGLGRYNYLSQCTLTAVPQYGYHFTQWSDGHTDNPREIILTRDTLFTALFAPNIYELQLQPNEETRGNISGAGAFEYLTECTITATADYGYHFASWSDGNTQNPRVLTLVSDTILTANFIPNTYQISTNTTTQGSVSGLGEYDYLSQCTLTAIPQYGYHFTQWNDGNTDNPREITLTRDTVFTAQFAIDKSGTCGDNNALTWEYESDIKTLFITGSGTLNSNFTYGIEAPAELQEVVIDEGVTEIGRAFYNISTLQRIILPNSLTVIGNYAFYGCSISNVVLPSELITIGSSAFRNCTGLTSITLPNNVTSIGSSAFEGCTYMQRITLNENLTSIGGSAFRNCTYLAEVNANMHFPPIIDASVFDGCGDLGEIPCFVHNADMIQYRKTNVWKTFKLMSVDEAVVETSTTSATVTAPFSTGDVASYSLTLYYQGEVFCTLTLNSNGQLVGIDFAHSQHRVAAFATSVNGLNIPITGLQPGTTYTYTLDALDSYGNIIDRHAGEFTTEGTTALENVSADGVSGVRKIIEDGKVVIVMPDGRKFDASGKFLK